MSRQPGYETTSYTGHGYEDRRETTAGRQAVDIGRPRGAGRAAGHSPDAATLAVRTELAQAELDYIQRRMRLIELTAP